MNESKELLEATIKGLEEKVSQVNDDLMMKKKEIKRILYCTTHHGCKIHGVWYEN